VTKAPQPYIDYLASASQTSLLAYELTIRIQAANLAAEIDQALEQLGGIEIKFWVRHRLQALSSVIDDLNLTYGFSFLLPTVGVPTPRKRLPALVLSRHDCAFLAMGWAEGRIEGGQSRSADSGQRTDGGDGVSI
jgi:hypothetical protein